MSILPQPAVSAANLQAIRTYIKQTWTTLRRSNAMLLEAAADPKVQAAEALTLYVARDEDPARIAVQLRAEVPADVFARLTVLPLPADPSTARESAMLYLPHPYVVPGGRFNEMYGWDSYFTLLGLVRDGELDLARAMTDNCLYEIIHYGMVLNANRPYYLTRSQPPFVTQMVLEVYKRTGDHAWLAASLPALEKYHAYWLREPHLTPATGLSRYHGGVPAPAPEAQHHEIDAQGRDHYDRVRDYYRMHIITEYDVTRYYDAAREAFTPDFYLGDRAMRESGFDLSARFGPFSTDIISYNSVDINSLLYRMEEDLADICMRLGRFVAARRWAERAAWRAAAINRLLWNENEGLYFDYNFERQRQSTYHFGTTFYPLWAGLASAQQAAHVAARLPIFEREWGLAASDRRTGHQWDAPFGWAPLQFMAVEGLRRYGFRADADRLSRKFVSVILSDFERTGTIKEKYDVEAGASELAGQIQYGYLSNEVGFGWTNAVFLVFANELGL